ncbi:MAG: hypothetical protein V4662_17745 [Verrucomicrobiota bacterium]
MSQVITPPRVSVLFVCHGSVYKAMPDVETYGLPYRDARDFKGDTSIVTHAPCRAWSQLKAFARPPKGERWLAVWSVLQVRRNGGVLEHPRGSALWDRMNLPKPYEPPDEWGGWTMEIDQFHWGHKARKSTWLYVVGTQEVPLMPYRAGGPTHVVANASRTRKREGPNKAVMKSWCTKSEREQTPPAFARWLVDLARRCSKFHPA